jgi:hypothetical protein
MVQQPGPDSPFEVGPAEADPLLRALVALIDKAHKSGAEIGITLNVRGTLVSGLLVSGRSYFEGVGRDFLTLGSGDLRLRAAMDNILSTVGASVYPAEENQGGEALHLDTRSLFIHLKNARFVHPNSRALPTNHGVWWRGRISSVDGFAFGVLSNAK